MSGGSYITHFPSSVQEMSEQQPISHSASLRRNSALEIIRDDANVESYPDPTVSVRTSRLYPASSEGGGKVPGQPPPPVLPPLNKVNKLSNYL